MLHYLLGGALIPLMYLSIYMGFHAFMSYSLKNGVLASGNPVVTEGETAALHGLCIVWTLTIIVGYFFFTGR